MQYVKVSFAITSQDGSDILIATLADAGYNGFEEHENKLFAYIESPRFLEAELQMVAASLNIGYEKKIVPEQNWNALWESNFEPVIVDDFCTVRAHFHDIETATAFDIVITPKMSFGTGHHATTQLMIRMMKSLGFNDKQVLDFGTGTGVLAILAEKLGARHVLAIDNDEWAVENARENVIYNECKCINVKAGSLEDAGLDETDLILANINRNVLLQYMQALHEKLNSGGLILMSGLLLGDRDIIVKAAAGAGLHLKEITGQANWIAMLFEKRQ